MERQIGSPSPGEFEELARRISDAATCEEYRDALDDMNIYLAAQREISTKLEALASRDPKCDVRRRRRRSNLGRIRRSSISRR